MKRILFFVLAAFAAAVPAASVLNEKDGEAWKLEIPLDYTTFRWGCMGDYEAGKISPLYQMLTNSPVMVANPKRMPSTAWINLARRSVLEPFLETYRMTNGYHCGWDWSPLMVRAEPIPTTEAELAAWNPYAMLKGYDQIDGGTIWPWHVKGRYNGSREFGERVRSELERCGFATAAADVSLWGEGETVTSYACRGNAERIAAVERAAAGGWRTLVPGVHEAVRGAYVSDNGYPEVWRIGIFGRSDDSLGFRVVSRRREVETTVRYKIREEGGKYYYSGTGSSSATEMVETNDFKISSVSVGYGGSYDGDQHVHLWGHVLAGIPSVDVLTNIENRCQAGTVDGIDVWLYRCDDVLGDIPLGESSISTRAESTWLETVDTTGYIDAVYNLATSYEGEGWRWFYTGYMDMELYLPMGTRIEQISGGGDNTVTESRVVERYTYEWYKPAATNIPQRVLLRHLASAAYEPRRESPVWYCGEGELETSWVNVGVIHYWSRGTYAPIYLGYRINGKVYGEREFDGSDTDQPVAGAVLGMWDAFPSIWIAQDSVRTDGWSVNVEASVINRQRVVFSGYDMGW